MKTHKDFIKVVRTLCQTGFTAKDIFNSKAVQEYYKCLMGYSYADYAVDDGKSYRRIYKLINETVQKFFIECSSKNIPLEYALEKAKKEINKDLKQEVNTSEKKKVVQHARQQDKENVEQNVINKTEQLRKYSNIESSAKIVSFVNDVITMTDIDESTENKNLLVASLSKAVRAVYNLGEGLTDAKFKTIQDYISTVLNFTINLQKEENDRVKTQAILTKLQSDSEYLIAKAKQIKDASADDSEQDADCGFEMQGV